MANCPYILLYFRTLYDRLPFGIGKPSILTLRHIQQAWSLLWSSMIIVGSFGPFVIRKNATRIAKPILHDWKVRKILLGRAVYQTGVFVASFLCISISSIVKILWVFWVVVPRLYDSTLSKNNANKTKHLCLYEYDLWSSDIICMTVWLFSRCLSKLWVLNKTSMANNPRNFHEKKWWIEIESFLA